MTQAAGVAYALLAALPAFVQAALALGAPWGRLTLGGKWPGRLPPKVRGAAAAQCVILTGLAVIALDHAGIIGPRWPAWLVWPLVAVTALTTAANLATPSRPERRLWGPITLAMLLCAIALAVT